MSTNTGYYNSGKHNTGNYNIGQHNTGDYNSGQHNTGDSNSGNSNTGDYNSGNYNTGDYNTGHYNTGHRNTGHRNSGHCNTGNCNTGNYNSGDWNTGFFNTSTPSTVTVFNNTEVDHEQFLGSIPDWLYQAKPAVWVHTSEMTEAQKAEHPEHETTGGFALERSMKAAYKQAWEASERDVEAVQAMPGFDYDVWLEITGVVLVPFVEARFVDGSEAAASFLGIDPETVVTVTKVVGDNACIEVAGNRHIVPAAILDLA